jgi:hypothetical protein
MKITNFNDSLVKLSWKNRTSENDSIIVQRGVGSATFTDFARIAPNDSVFNDTTTVLGKTYYYRLRANFKDSIEIQSYPIRLNNVSATSSINMQEQHSISVYPNPTGNRINIRGLEQITLVRIYSISGELVRSARLDHDDNSISLIGLNDGIYLLTCTSGQETWNMKFIKQGNKGF